MNKKLNQTDQTWLLYDGIFDDEITSNLNSILTRSLELKKHNPQIRKKLKSLMIEQVQNIQRYSSRPHEGTVKIGFSGDHFFIETTNPVAETQKKKLRLMLEEITQLENEIINSRYQQELRKPMETESSNAGLGLWFLAKHTSKTLTYQFSRLSRDQFLFTIRSYVQGEIS